VVAVEFENVADLATLKVLVRLFGPSCVAQPAAVY
jgi:hypothetical protein